MRPAKSFALRVSYRGAAVCPVAIAEAVGYNHSEHFTIVYRQANFNEPFVTQYRHTDAFATARAIRRLRRAFRQYAAQPPPTFYQPEIGADTTSSRRYRSNAAAIVEHDSIVSGINDMPH